MKRIISNIPHALLVLLFFSSCLYAAKQPNVLVYLADDLGYGSINTYGAPEALVQTPHLNRLAAEGVQFDNAYTPASVCTPTRYSMLTGEYSWRSRLKRGTISKTDYTLIDPNRVSLGRWMQQQGYVTAHVGKWHLGYKAKGPVVNLLGDLHPGAIGSGFDYHFGVPYNLEDMHKVYIENNGIWKLGSNKLKPYGSTWYARRRGNIAPYIGYDAPQRVTENVMTMTTDKAVEWLEKQSSDQPFFLYYAAVAVHNPIEPAPEMRGKSKAGLYGDFIQEVDHTFGRLIECLKSKGLLKDTLIIFASDNGGERYASGMPHCEAEAKGLSINGSIRGKKSEIWEGGFKTPLIISHLNGTVPNGERSQARVSVVDFYATLVDYVAGDSALRNLDAPDSVSFKEALLKPKTSNFERPPLVLCDSKGRKAVHFGQWKYVEAMEGKKRQPAQLFDMEADPMERHNLIGFKPQVAERGRRTLEAIVDGDDAIEWDSGGGGYRHAPAYDPKNGQFHLELKAITGLTGQSYCYIYKDMPSEAGEQWKGSIFARLTESPGGGAASAQFKMTFLDARGEKLRSFESAKLKRTSGAYRLLQIEGTAPEGTVTVRMTPVVNLQGEEGTVAAFFDDARLASNDSIFESGFETAAAP